MKRLIKKLACVMPCILVLIFSSISVSAITEEVYYAENGNVNFLAYDEGSSEGIYVVKSNSGYNQKVSFYILADKYSQDVKSNLEFTGYSDLSPQEHLLDTFWTEFYTPNMEKIEDWGDQGAAIYKLEVALSTGRYNFTYQSYFHGNYRSKYEPLANNLKTYHGIHYDTWEELELNDDLWTDILPGQNKRVYAIAYMTDDGISTGDFEEEYNFYEENYDAFCEWAEERERTILADEEAYAEYSGATETLEVAATDVDVSDIEPSVNEEQKVTIIEESEQEEVAPVSQKKSFSPLFIAIPVVVIVGVLLVIVIKKKR